MAPRLGGAAPASGSHRRGEAVVVVGAGLAGLSAARALLLSGRCAAVRVLEAKQTPGGRAGGATGATWAHAAAGGPLQALAAGIGVSLEPLAGGLGLAAAAGPGDVCLCDGESGNTEFAPEQVAAAAGAFELLLEEALTLRESWPEGKAWSLLGGVHRAKDQLDEAGELPLLSLAEQRVLTWLVGRAAAAWMHGACLEDGAAAVYLGHEAKQRIYEALATGLDVRYGAPVAAIVRSPGGCVVRLEGGEELRCDRVVCALPLGVLKQSPGAGVTGLAEISQDRNQAPIHYDLPPGPRFAPPLPPPRRKELRACEVAHANVFRLRFLRAFWPSAIMLGSCADSAARCVYVFNEHALTGEPVLSLLLSGSDAVALESIQGEDEARAVATAALRAVLPKGCEIQSLVSVERSYWARDPFARGAVSLADRAELLATPTADMRLFFAGDYASGRHRGTLDGALLSGEAAAAQVMEAIHDAGQGAGAVPSEASPQPAEPAGQPTREAHPASRRRLSKL